jgi:hypothetical protein
MDNNDNSFKRVFALHDSEAKNLLTPDTKVSRVELFYLNNNKDRVKSSINLQSDKEIHVVFNSNGYFGSFFVKPEDEGLEFNSEVLNGAKGELTNIEGVSFKIVIKNTKVFLVGMLNSEIFFKYIVPDIEYVSVIRKNSVVCVKKHRQEILLDGKKAYIDFFDNHKSFPLLNILFDTKEDMLGYNPINYAKQEVTNFEDYSDEYIAAL